MRLVSLRVFPDWFQHPSNLMKLAALNLLPPFSLNKLGQSSLISPQTFHAGFSHCLRPFERPLMAWEQQYQNNQMIQMGSLGLPLSQHRHHHLWHSPILHLCFVLPCQSILTQRSSLKFLQTSRGDFLHFLMISVWQSMVLEQLCLNNPTKLTSFLEPIHLWFQLLMVLVLFLPLPFQREQELSPFQTFHAGSSHCQWISCLPPEYLSLLFLYCLRTLNMLFETPLSQLLSPWFDFLIFPQTYCEDFLRFQKTSGCQPRILELQCQSSLTRRRGLLGLML